jgi:hypothetical protein
MEPCDFVFQRLNDRSDSTELVEVLVVAAWNASKKEARIVRTVRLGWHREVRSRLAQTSDQPGPE